MLPELSVVMPAYNEEGAIADAVEEVRQQVFARVPDAELVVVDDGSRDATGKILDDLANVDSRLRVIHRPNGGHGPALRTGLDAARGNYLLLIDSDRQIPLDCFGPFWERSRDCDAVCGIRAQRHDPKLRLKLTALIRRVLPLLFGVRIRDANVPFKLVRRAVWQDAAALIPPETLAPSLFLAVFLRRSGAKVAEIPVTHRERRTGTVSIRRWKLFKFCFRAFGQLLAFRRRLARWERNRTS